jgi:hypothetical protein
VQAPVRKARARIQNGEISVGAIAVSSVIEDSAPADNWPHIHKQLKNANMAEINRSLKETSVLQT